MGKEHDGKNGAAAETAAAAGSTSGNSSTRTATGRGAGAGAGAAAAAKTTEPAKPNLVAPELPEGAAEVAAPAPEPPKRGRGRPPGSKNKTTPTARTRRRAPTKKQTEELAKDISTIIAGASALAAPRLGQHWLMTPEEVQGTIGDPMARLIQKHMPADAAEKYGDWVALAFGAVMLAGPRVMTTVAMMAEQKQKEAAGIEQPKLRAVKSPEGGGGGRAASAGDSPAATGNIHPRQSDAIHDGAQPLAAAIPSLGPDY